jgi:hypothetical protein
LHASGTTLPQELREVLCPVCCRILNSGTPLSKAVVAKPARGEWAPSRSRSRTPARPNALFRIHATEAGSGRLFARSRPVELQNLMLSFSCQAHVYDNHGIGQPGHAASSWAISQSAG